MSSFPFQDPGELLDDDLYLRLVQTKDSDVIRGWVPMYMFQICVYPSGEVAGEINLRLGDTESLRLYGGHIGYGVRPRYRGRRFAARAVKLLLPLARAHGMRELWITCNPDNLASRRTCELAGAEFVEIVDLPSYLDMYREGERQKCRYRLALS